MNIKDTKLYKNIKFSDKEVVAAIPFKAKSGITITASNIEFIVESEVIQYNSKLEMIKNLGVDYPVDIHFEEKLREELETQIGQERLEVKFIYVNQDTINLNI
jgi:hypothetical protein